MQSNAGDADLEFAASVNGDDFALQLEPPIPTSLGPGGQADLCVTFAPTENLPRTGQLMAMSNDPTGDATASLAGHGRFPELRIDPTYTFWTS